MKFVQDIINYPALHFIMQLSYRYLQRTLQALLPMHRVEILKRNKYLHIDELTVELTDITQQKPCENKNQAHWCIKQRAYLNSSNAYMA